jgi:hypothetical protein
MNGPDYLLSYRMSGKGDIAVTQSIKEREGLWVGFEDCFQR